MESPREPIRSAERMKFFTDAVVAIAMTLLILPLLEAVTEAAHEGLTTREYLRDNGGSLFAFALSFTIIASFWTLHHGLYERVEEYTKGLLWLNMAWMFTIVWLPVPTAMAGTMDTDRPQIALYIGTMTVSSAVMVAAYVVARRSPAIWSDAEGPRVGGLAVAIALTVLYGLALVLALALPPVNYFALFLLCLTGPAQGLVRRRLTSAATRG